ncbi:MAG: ABC transporter permease [Acutalibacteraceae bacterium]|jgi:ABC-2 type transport system permease protein
MNQFGKIFNFELKSYFKNKIFVGVTVFLVLLITALMFYPRIKDTFKTETDTLTDNRAVMLVKPVSQEKSEITKTAFAAAFANYDVRLTEANKEQIAKSIRSGEAECAFVITGDTSYTYYVNNLSMYDVNSAVAEEVLQNLYRINAMIGSGMSPEQASAVMDVKIEGKTEKLGVDQMQNYWYTYIMIFALYMVILLYGQMVATNVASEKSSRAMELLITSAKPVSMMFGKVLASCLAGLIQLVAIFSSSVICYNLNKSYWKDNWVVGSIFDMPPNLLLYMILFFVLGFFIYAFLYGAIGSTATKLEDINTSVMPVTMLFIIAFFIVIFSLASSRVDTVLMKICSFIPFTSPMAMFTRIAMSTVAWYEIAASVAILIISVIGVGIISAKIYRVGVLLYGTAPKLGAVIKAVFKA